MAINPRILKAYLNHFLPREVVGPVIIVFSLEGVIDGIFSMYVPETFETIGWGVIFLLALTIVAYWGSIDDPAIEELHEQIDDIQEQEATGDDRS